MELLRQENRRTIFKPRPSAIPATVLSVGHRPTRDRPFYTYRNGVAATSILVSRFVKTLDCNTCHNTKNRALAQDFILQGHPSVRAMRLRADAVYYTEDLAISIGS
jgi:hypothetical protein